jgi:hypothetical protein
MHQTNGVSVRKGEIFDKMSNNPEGREPPGFSEGKIVEGIDEPSAPGQVGEPAEFQCQICGQVFTNQADLSEHMLTHERQPRDKKEEKKPAGVG